VAMDMVDDLSGSHLDDDVRRAILVIVDPEGSPDSSDPTVRDTTDERHGVGQPSIGASHAWEPQTAGEDRSVRRSWRWRVELSTGFVMGAAPRLSRADRSERAFGVPRLTERSVKEPPDRRSERARHGRPYGAPRGQIAGSVHLGVGGRGVIMRGGRRVRSARTIDARVRSVPSPGDRL